MPGAERVVLDTSVLVSGLLFPGSAPNLALAKAQLGALLGSDVTLLELMQAMGSDGFEAYLGRRLRQELVAEFANSCVHAEIISPIYACRDARQNKFLEVAVNGHADFVVTRDRELLDLNPFRGIAILTPAAYLELKEPADWRFILKTR